ncbi:UNVERIFIED_ORG: hypothetical protein J2806_003083 [Kosakonia oryzae]|uniref:DUF3592 domain-containing protein n=1 Tax=Kosakonia radicincitans TaxID=283686 RepID=A0AAX2ER34_9ENTR|nr:MULTISPECIES: DUF3592 domain-containing protein [Kosakonia]MDP9567411.1 hypothetical protein [Kosakonia oryzae]APG18482.1 hypothetical protein A3780_13265 [Kosakonia radicincitans]NCF09005.1 DUF3592 domain-containing protein [Kosakonia sp. MH5]PTA91785.1 DUF3592 domain-containing protein [Kosakonia sp. H7A]SFF45658.1 hypothetical protein SAMN03159468_05357 [Kosakonia radicincitans]
MSNAFIISMVVIALVFGVFPIARFLYTTLYPYLKDGFSQDAVLKNGIAVNADIIYTEQTSSWDGNKPVYKLTLRFKTAEHQVVEATTMKALTFKEIEQFKEGNGTTIKYDPKDPKKIAIYDKPLVLGQ